MRRSVRILLRLLAAAILLPLLALAAVVAALNTNPGRHLAETQIAAFTGNTVHLQGLSGRFPDALRLRHLELHDAQGPYLLADGIELDWTPSRLLQKIAQIDRLEAARIQLPRLPAASPPSSEPSAPFQLPLHVQATRVHIARIELGAPVLGTPAVLDAEARADLPSLEAGAATIGLRRLDSEGRYTLAAQVGPAHIDAKIEASEPESGLIAQLASLPNLGPLRLEASIQGPRSALATNLTLSAGPLEAAATGTADLVNSAADLNVTASAPAMTPAPDISWQSIALQARIHGPFSTPDASGHLRIERLAAPSTSLRSLVADLEGNAGRVALHATAEDLRIPGPNPALLAATPLTLDAAIRLDDPARPASFTLSHPLLAITGQARTAGDPDLTADLQLPDLAPFAALGAIDLQGSTTLQLHATRSAATSALDATGVLRITGGLPPIPGLIGNDAKLALSAQLTGEDLAITRLDLAGRTLTLAAQGSRKAGQLDARAKVGLTDLAAAAPTLTGALQADARIQGPTDNLSLTAAVTGALGAPGVPSGPIKLDLALQGLPATPTGTLNAEGTLAGAPITLALKANRDPEGALHALIERAAWRSLHAEGALHLAPGATLPKGRIDLRMARLDDLRPFTGQPLSGAVAATLELDAAEARLRAEATNAGLPGSRIGHATLTARITDPATHPAVTAAMALQGIDAGGTTGSAKADVSGSEDALNVRTSASLRMAETDAQIQAAGIVNGPAKHVVLSSFQVIARNETARLQAPATIRFADGIAVDRLRIALRQATLDVTGQLSPRLNATIALRTPADLAAIADPSLAMDGTVALDAQLTGTLAQPGGTIRLQANGLRMKAGPGRAIPPATVSAAAQLAGTSARVDARLAAGSANLSVTGQAPLGAGPLNMRADGTLDLALLDPILSPGGRRARGKLALDAVIGGTAAAPRVTGSAQLANGELQDFGQGLRITALTAAIRADGETIRIQNLNGRAGPGTIAASGTIGLGPTLPLDLALTMRNARPLESDRLTADLDADLTLRGPVTGALAAAGRILVRRAEIRIPETLPANIAVLDVRRPGQKPPAPSAASPVALDLTIDAPRAVFVRGRGVDAELGGMLRLRGSSAAPQVGGGLEMRRGAVSLAGTTLTFSRGKVGFDGAGLSGRIDPTLDFAADSTSGGVTATLGIGGYASAPKITLTSVPSLPQDEVLAYLLFKRSAKELGPFQIAQIAASLASLTGVGGGGANPLEAVRKGLGLDRLSVGAGATPNSAPTIEAGRYVANGVYVGAKQGTAGGQTGATVQIDIARGLKLQTDVGSGQGGNQVGLTYQFEY